MELGTFPQGKFWRQFSRKALKAKTQEKEKKRNPASKLENSMLLSNQMTENEWQLRLQAMWGTGLVITQRIRSPEWGGGKPETGSSVRFEVNKQRGNYISLKIVYAPVLWRPHRVTLYSLCWTLTPYLSELLNMPLPLSWPLSVQLFP